MISYPVLLVQAILPDGVGSCTVRTNTSKHTLAFPDFPLLETASGFPSHSDVLQYLRDYAAHFGLHTYLHLNTMVESVESAAKGKWMVYARTGEQVSTETFHAVVVYSGRDRSHQLVHPPGSETFAGRILHSSSYKGPEEFAGKRIVVVGVGSSGVDIATELSRVADRLYLSTEHSTWFIPRYVLGRPYDHQLTRLAQRLPYRLRLFLFSRLLLFEYRRMGVTPHQLQARGLPLPSSISGVPGSRPALISCNASNPALFTRAVQNKSITLLSSVFKTLSPIRMREQENSMLISFYVQDKRCSKPRSSRFCRVQVSPTHL